MLRYGNNCAIGLTGELLFWRDYLMKVDILGTKYEILKGSVKKFPHLKDSDGYIDTSIKRIVVLDMQTFEKDESRLADLDYYAKKVKRHEITHAFMYESGLSVSSADIEQWATNEEMIDWFAIQAPKMYKAFKDADCI